MTKETSDSLPRPVLIGLMGCGKSSVGRRLSERLNIPLIDLDDYIVQQAGMSIPEIFERLGEEAFRDMESKALAETIEKRAILASGGGVVLREANRQLLKGHPPVIWLKAAPEYLAKRISGDANRPLIANQDTLKKLSALAAERYPLYEECADLVIDRDQVKKKDVVTEIIDYLNEGQ